MQLNLPGDSGKELSFSHSIYGHAARESIIKAADGARGTSADVSTTIFAGKLLAPHAATLVEHYRATDEYSVRRSRL